MTDTNTKQIAKDKFEVMVKEDLDQLFDQAIPQKEADLIVMKEVGTILGQMTAMNNMTADILTETKEDLAEVTGVEKQLGDLKRLGEVREELDKAA